MKSVIVKLPDGRSVEYTHRTFSVEEGLLLIRVSSEEAQTIVAVYAPGHWAYAELGPECSTG